MYFVTSAIVWLTRLPVRVFRPKIVAGKTSLIIDPCPATLLRRDGGSANLAQVLKTTNPYLANCWRKCLAKAFDKLVLTSAGDGRQMRGIPRSGLRMLDPRFRPA